MNRITCGNVRACLARHVGKWDKEKTKEILYRGKGHGQFRLIESDDWPSNETWFDVAFDAETLYVSVMALEAGERGSEPGGPKFNMDVVEVFLDPFCDRIGYQQFVAGNDGLRAENSHWPYRNPGLDKHRDASWDIDVQEDAQSPDLVRFYFFRFDLDAVRGADCIGFNVCRSQNRISENSSWNLVSGIGFCDAGCFGRLWFREPPARCQEAGIKVKENVLKSVVLTGVRSRFKGARVGVRVLNPSGQAVAEWKPRAIKEKLSFRPPEAVWLLDSGRYRVCLEAVTAGKAMPVEPGEFFFDYAGPKRQSFQLQATYDWPDNFGNVAYSPRDLEQEMQWYKDCGLDRIYWLDYPPEMWMAKRGHGPGHWSRHIEESYRLHGRDFLWSAARAAHKAGQEFITIFKPFDLSPDEPFLVEHPEFQVRRNPAWARPRTDPIASLRVYQCDERPFPFRANGVEVWQSPNNRRYERIGRGLHVRESIVNRPVGVWSPCGVVTAEGARRVRCMTIDGLAAKGPYLALSAPNTAPDKELRNRACFLAELRDVAGNPVPYVPDIRQRIPETGFDFGPRRHNEASWARMDTGIERLVVVRGDSMALGFSVKQETYLRGFPEPSFPEVREFWLQRLRRGIEADADGISIRIAHHVGCVDWLSYAYAEPLIEEFRRRTGRDPEPEPEDYALVRMIRGDFYTEFVRQASSMARSSGKLFAHHIENRMLVPPTYDCYCQIHWDWRTWICEGLVDEVDLKYIGPDHPDCYREIVPLARRHGVKVNYICADPDPRGRPRSIHEGPLILQRAMKAGLNGINLYELWLYRRMTDRGCPMTRGSGEAVIREMRACLHQIQER